MTAPFERRALSFNGKPVVVYVAADTGSAAAALVLARCRGAGMRAERTAADEAEYIAQIQQAMRDIGFQAILGTLDDRQITLDIHRAP